MSLSIVFAGTPVFATYPLQALLGSSHRVSAVFTQPDRPAGRGNKLTPPAVKVLAEANHLPVHQPLSLKDAESQALIAQYQPDVMIVVAYGLLLPEAVLSMPKYGCLNIHGSLLPRWRGAAPIARAISAGDKQTGVDIMKMDVGLDTGDIVARAVLPLLPSDTQPMVHDSLAHLGANLLLQVLSDLPSYLARSKAQSSVGITYAHKLNKEEGKIDWTQSAEQIVRQVNAFTPWPGSFCVWQEQVLKLGEALLVDQVVEAPAGKVLALTAEGYWVATGRGAVCFGQLQRSGGKMLSAQAFHQGCDLVGQILA